MAKKNTKAAPKKAAPKKAAAKKTAPKKEKSKDKAPEKEAKEKKAAPAPKKAKEISLDEVKEKGYEFMSSIKAFQKQQIANKRPASRFTTAWKLVNRVITRNLKA